MSFQTLKQHLDSEFPEIWRQVDPARVTTVLLIQIKGGDVHPNNRNPEIRGKKTQVDITAPTDESLANPTTALFCGEVNSEGLTRWPIKAWDSRSKKWVSTDVKVSGIGQSGPYTTGQRIKLGGSDPNTWSSIVWANMGHYENDPNGFILFVREGMTSPPHSFSLPDHETLRGLLLEYGASPEESTFGQTWTSTDGKYANLFGTPKSKSVAINGTWDSDVLHQRTNAEYVYAATNPSKTGPRAGWIKIGRTDRSPIDRLKEYDNAFEYYDMNYIRMTSDSRNAEKELIRRLELVGMKPKSNEGGRSSEWFKTNSIETIKNCIDEVVSLYPHSEDVACQPIIRSSPGESWLYPNVKSGIFSRFVRWLKSLFGF